MLGPRLGTGRERRADARFTHPTQPRTHARTHAHGRGRRTIPNTETARGILTHGIPVVGPRDGSAGNVAGVKSASQEPVPRGDQATLSFTGNSIQPDICIASFRARLTEYNPSPEIFSILQSFPDCELEISRKIKSILTKRRVSKELDGKEKKDERKSEFPREESFVTDHKGKSARYAEISPLAAGFV